jgi:hypothetical protein
MRRDLTLDLAALDRLPTSDLLDEANRRALDPGRGHDLDPAPSRRRATTGSLAVAVVGLAIATFVWLSSAFRTTPAPPAEPTASNYVFTNVRPGAFPPDADEADVVIRFDVSWSGEDSPGVHRCVFRLFDVEGAVVAERIDWTPWKPADGYAVEVPRVTPARPESAEARCDAERLDTPGIASIEDPIVPNVDEDGRIEDFSEELERRVDAWSQHFSVGSMSQEELAANVAALANARSRYADDLGLDRLSELLARISRLCDLVDPTMDVRGC